MAKSRKTKAKRKDFQKVKLKVGKTLPKGLNETTTKFKSASIQIKEQLKEKDGSQPTTKKNQNAQDLLTQCLHYNASVRMDSIIGLISLVKLDGNVVHTNLSTVVERATSLIIDKDDNVRQKVHQLLRAIFGHLSESQISPFFPLISAHITCAMTHLFEPIQQDSLKVVDICLEFYPQLMIQSSSRFLPCFMQQIATLSGKKSKKRTLISNPSSKRSSQAWRMQVFQRLYKVFSAIKDNENDKEDKNNVCFKNWDVKYSDYVLGSAAFSNNNLAQCHLNRLDSAAHDPKDHNMHQFVSELVPLLFDCWMEARPVGLTTESNFPIQCMVMLDSILSMLQVLPHFHSTIEAEYKKDVLEYFVPFFPFAVNKHQLEAKKNKKHMLSVDSINLCMCDILTRMVQHEEVMPEWFNSVIDYLECYLVPNATSCTPLFISLLTRLMRKWPDKSALLFEKSLGVFSVAHSSEEIRAWISYFIDVTFTSKNRTAEQEHILDMWMASLTTYLLKVDMRNEKLVSLLLLALNKAASTGSPQLLETFVHHLDKLLDLNLWQRSDDQQHQIEKVTLLFWLPQFPPAILSKLKTILLANPTLCCRFLQLMSWRTAAQGFNFFSKDLYISFLFSLLNCTKDQCRLTFNEQKHDCSKADVMAFEQVCRNIKEIGSEIQMTELHDYFHEKLM